MKGEAFFLRVVFCEGFVTGVFSDGFLEAGEGLKVYFPEGSDLVLRFEFFFKGDSKEGLAQREEEKGDEETEDGFVFQSWARARFCWLIFRSTAFWASRRRLVENESFGYI